MKPDDARRFAEAWCDAWNRHDLDAILAHYADPPHHTSPLVAERLGRPDGSIRDRHELAAYFRRGLDGTPPLRFTLRDVLAGASGLAIVYENHRAKLVVETMDLDAHGKIARSAVYYREAAPPGRA